jgi:hypothetical protein
MTVSVSSLVLETTTTTGTGTYTLLGASANHLAFSTIVTPAATALVTYTVRMGAVYERGIGLLSAANTLQRIKVVESTNADAAVDWAAGTKDVACAPAMAGSALGRHIITTTHPATTNNYTEGYAEGSTWVVTLDDGGDKCDDVYFCTRAGIPGTTPAGWMLGYTHALYRPTEQGGSAKPAFSVGLGYYDNTILAAAENAVIHGIGAKPRWANSRTYGLGYAWGNNGGHQAAEGGLHLETTNATPTKMEDGWTGVTCLGMEPSSTVLFEITIVARDNATPDSKSWTMQVHVDRAGSGDPVIDTENKTVIGETAGAAAWDVDVGIDTTNDGIYIEATGAAAKTIRWSAHIRAVQTAFT